MANVNFGFTPEFARLLQHMGINFEAMRANVGHGASSSQYAPISWDPVSGQNDLYFQLKKQGINPGGNVYSPQVQAQIQSKKKQGAINSDVMRLYNSVLNMRQQEANRGAPDTAPHKGFFSRILDIISRPGRGVTTGMYYGQQDVNKAEQEHKSFAGFRGFDKFVEGFAKGFTGKDQKTGAQYAEDQLGIHNKVAKFAAGLGIDVAADPLSYVGLGIGKKAIDVGQAAKSARVAEDTAAQLAAGPKLGKGFVAPSAEEINKSLGGRISGVLTPSAKAQAAVQGAAHIDKVSTILGAQAGKSAQLAITDDLTKLGLTKGAAKTSASKWLNPKYALDPAVQSEKRTYGQLIKTIPGMSSTKYLDTTLPSLVNDAKTTAARQLSETLNANLEQQVRRTLNLKGVGLSAPIAPIPEPVVKALSNVAKAPILNNALKSFDKGFNTGSGFDHELYMTKSRAAGKAEQRINIGTQKLIDGFSGINKAQRLGYMKALTGTPQTYGRGVITLKDGRDMADLAQEVFGYVGKYVDWSGKGLGVISLHKLNSYLPEKYKFDTSILQKHPQIFNPDASKGSQNFLNLIASQRQKYANVDPQDLFYHLYIGTEKVLARDQFLRAIGDLGVPIKAHNLADAQIGKEGNTVAHQLVAKHGYVTIPTKGEDAVTDPSFARYLEGKVFHPEVQKGLVKMLDMINNEKITEGFMRGYDRALSYFKKSVTLPMPSYHIRNSVGDVFTSYVDGVTGARGMASYAQAAKVMRMINPVTKDAQIKQILEAPVTTGGKIEDPMKQIAQLLKVSGDRSVTGNLVMKKNPKWKDIPGKYVSAEQFQAAYQHTGLKRGFVASDLERELRGNPNLFMKGLHLPIDQITKFSQAREDFFRMAHFIDRIKRSKAPTFEEAAKEAAYYVKKHHFDYTDVTNFERTVMARAIPFYKFQRFATPLMLQAFFSTPGKILNAQKVLNNLAYANGYTNDGGFLPTADQIMPEYMRDTMMIPLFEQAGNTVYGGGGLLPSTSIFAQTLGLGGTNPGRQSFENVMQSLTPAAQIPVEELYGKRILGGGQIPIGSQKDYLISKNPLANLALGPTGTIGNAPGGEKFVKLLNALSGLGLSENTPARQKSELYRQRDLITANRKKSGFTTKKKPTPGTMRPDSYKPRGS